MEATQVEEAARRRRAKVLGSNRVRMNTLQPGLDSEVLGDDSAVEEVQDPEPAQKVGTGAASPQRVVSSTKESKGLVSPGEESEKGYASHVLHRVKEVAFPMIDYAVSIVQLKSSKYHRLLPQYRHQLSSLCGIIVVLMAHTIGVFEFAIKSKLSKEHLILFEQFGHLDILTTILFPLLHLFIQICVLPKSELYSIAIFFHLEILIPLVHLTLSILSIFRLIIVVLLAIILYGVVSVTPTAGGVSTGAPNTAPTAGGMFTSSRVSSDDTNLGIFTRVAQAIVRSVLPLILAHAGTLIGSLGELQKYIADYCLFRIAAAVLILLLGTLNKSFHPFSPLGPLL